VDAKSPAGTVRGSASIPIHVSWTARSGEHECAEARIIKITRFGATIELASILNPSQEIMICRDVGGKETAARVVDLIEKESNWHTYRVMFTELAPRSWEDQTPPAADSGSSQQKVFLECASCLSRAQVILNEIQAEVFAARGLVMLFCKKCHSLTVWALAAHDVSPGPIRRSGKEPARARAAAPRTANRRKHSRVHSMAMACVRYSGVTEEVVRVMDASRGGFRFVSSLYYTKGSNIMVAVPFMRDSPNIFVPAKIMWRRELQRLEKREYGVAYQR